jgi:hypothetical protein
MVNEEVQAEVLVVEAQAAEELAAEALVAEGDDPAARADNAKEEILDRNAANVTAARTVAGGYLEKRYAGSAVKK